VFPAQSGERVYIPRNNIISQVTTLISTHSISLLSGDLFDL
jgi:hypothetical protein